jgi:hypothetical protein
VLVLAIGIGVNTAVFTAYKAVVAQPLDARNPDEMVNIALTRDSGDSSYRFSYPDYEMYRDSIRSLNGLVAFRPDDMTISNAGPTISRGSQFAESLLGSWTGIRGGSSDEFAGVFAVSKNYFEVLGVAAIQGRTFESISTSELLAFPSVLISENYWQRRFEGDPAILGKTIHLNSVPVTIIGITPRDFRGTGGSVPAFWLPASIEPLVTNDAQWLHNRENQCYRLFGRLAPGASIAEAKADMSRVADHVRTLHDPLSESAKPATALVWPGSPEGPLRDERSTALDRLAHSGRHRDGSSRRLCQCRQPAIGPGPIPRERAADTFVSRGQPPARHQAAPDGECSRRTAGGDDRFSVLLGAAEGVGGLACPSHYF